MTQNSRRECERRVGGGACFSLSVREASSQPLPPSPKSQALFWILLRRLPTSINLHMLLPHVSRRGEKSTCGELWVDEKRVSKAARWRRTIFPPLDPQTKSLSLPPSSLAAAARSHIFFCVGGEEVFENHHTSPTQARRRRAALPWNSPLLKETDLGKNVA